MREYILETARNLCRQHADVTIDEIAAIAGIDASHVHDYFRGVGELYEALTGELV
ncbi:TetR/AcrR family transcriptional regulator [Nocardia sp. NBC_01499]|uniref:TetR family transcriptional regulator n=1 Tax=Nocardia sp. NBC_01499 TaxID=2903597 RepID=UPI0038635C9A